jgi:hypothetical protein
MNRDLIRPLNKTVKRKPRLFGLDSGNFYAGYLQNNFPEETATAYVFSSTPPVVGDRIVDQLDGEQYTVLSFRTLRRWKRGQPYFKMLLSPLIGRGGNT